VKFDHLDAGPHTFVVERKNKKVALYQAYERKYSLKEYMENKGKGEHVQLPKGGMLMEPSLAYDKVISLLYNGLGTEQTVQQCKNDLKSAPIITTGMYKAAFGSSLDNPAWRHNHFGEAIPSVAVFVFDNIVANDGVEEKKTEMNESKTPITFYEEIQAIDRYDKLIHPDNPNQTLTEEEQQEMAKSQNVKEYVKSKGKSPFLEVFGKKRAGLKPTITVVKR
jgi:hypothetical protein